MGRDEELKDELLRKLFRLLALLGTLALVPSVYASLAARYWFLAAFDCLAYAGVLYCAFSPRAGRALKLRVLVFGSLGIGAVVLLQTGAEGAGYIWLLCAVVFSALFGKARVIALAIGGSVLSMSAYALLNALGVLAHRQALIAVVVITSNLVLISLGLAFVIRELLGRLESALAEKEALAARLGAELEETRRKDAELGESLEAKEELLRELHHRVKNNLQVTLSLVGLERGDAAAARLERRIRAISAANDSFLADPDAKAVELEPLLRVLAAEFVAPGEGSGDSAPGRLAHRVANIQLRLPTPRLPSVAIAVAEVLEAFRTAKLPAELALEGPESDRGAAEPLLALRAPADSGAEAATALAAAALDQGLAAALGPAPRYLPPAPGKGPGIGVPL